MFSKWPIYKRCSGLLHESISVSVIKVTKVYHPPFYQALQRRAKSQNPTLRNPTGESQSLHQVGPYVALYTSGFGPKKKLSEET